MGWAFIFGRMAVFTKVSIQKIKSRVLVCIHGQTVVDMKVTGTVENNMVWDHIEVVIVEKLNWVYGRMESVLSGLVLKKFLK